MSKATLTLFASRWEYLEARPKAERIKVTVSFGGHDKTT